MFLVDDMGWQDTSVPFYNNERSNLNQRFRTPNMERLAQLGIRFTEAYACAISSPTRCSLMSGMNASRHRVTNWTLELNQQTDAKSSVISLPQWNYNGIQPDSTAGKINNSTPITSLPQVLKDNGYYTIHCGKAHFGARTTPGADPATMGFDVNIAGGPNGAPGSYLGTKNFGQGSKFAVYGLEKYYGQDIFLTEALTREALNAMKKSVEMNKPFYLYMSHYAVHSPYDEDKRFTPNYRGQFDEQLNDTLNENEVRYAALVEGMDKSLGDVLDYLEAKGIADDTIILFMSDNGGHCLGQDKGGEPHTQNLPLREGKASVYEGGIRVPLIFRWPGKAAEGTRLNTPVINEDIFPTILEMAGVKHYETVQECDGLSLVKLITAGSKMVAKAQKRGEIATRKEVNAFVVPASVSGIDPERELIFHYPHQYRVEDQDDIDFMSAVRKGDWKLVYRMHTGELELYNLRDDIGERNDLAASHPERVAELAKALGDRLRAWKAPMPTVRTTGKPVPMPDEL